MEEITMETDVQMELFNREVLKEMKEGGDCFTAPTQSLLNVMIKAGMSPRAISGLLEFTGVRKDHRHYFGAPVISSESQWKDMIPGWLKRAVYQERFEIICREYRKNEIGFRAGITEALAVLMPASMEAPLDHEWANIYVWCGKEAGIRYQGKSEEHFKDICDFAELGNDEKRNLDRLLMDIRSKVIKNHW